MQFIKRKNLLEREEVKFLPVLHWMYVVKPVLITLVSILVLFFTQRYVLNVISMYFPELFFYSIVLAIVVFSFVLILYIYRYHTTEYGVTNKRLIIKKGAFSIITTEIPTDRIESIYCYQSLLGRLFNYGNIYQFC